MLAPGGFLSFDVPSRALDAPALPPGALAPDAYRAALVVTRQEFSAGGTQIVLDVRVTNASNQAWPAGVPLNLGNHWLAADGVVVVADDRRVAVPLPLGPGQSVSLRFSAPLPADSAVRTLELDVVHEGVAWFAWMDSATVRLDIGFTAPVQAPAAPAREFEPVMEMHAVPREDVEALLAAAGVRLLRVRQEAHCGPRWEAFRYDVTAGTSLLS